MSATLHPPPEGNRPEGPRAAADQGADRLSGGNELRTLTSLAIAVVVVTTLYVARELLIPVALAILLSFILAPLVVRLRRFWLGRTGAVLVAVLIALAVILALGDVIGTQLGQVVAGMPRYASTIEGKIEGVRDMVTERISATTRMIVPQARPAPATPTTTSTVADGAPAVPVPVEVRPNDPSPIEIARLVLLPVLGPLGTAFVVFIMTIFFLLHQTDLRDRMIRLLGPRDLHRSTRALGEAASRLSRYLLTQLSLNAVFGTVIGIGVALIGVPNPVLWGTLAMLCRFVPYVGSSLAAAMPIAVAAAVAPGWGLAIETALLFMVVQFSMGQFVDPVAYGRSTGLSPVSVVLATIFWAWMWGPVGLILAVPLTVCLVVVGRHVPRLAFLDVLMGDRPALSAAEGLYHRLLANDTDDALATAEAMLKDRALSAYYDEVAIPALRHAADDAERGVMSDTQTSRIQLGFEQIIETLDSFDDTTPAAARPRSVERSGTAPGHDGATPIETVAIVADPVGSLSARWTAPGAVLCIAGNGPMDKILADIVAQLLAKHGIGARALEFVSAGRAAIGQLDITNVAALCVCSLDFRARPSQVRYLTRRLRQRAPGMPLLTGLWSTDDAAADERLQSAISVDHLAGSLQELVSQCLQLAQTPVAEPAVQEQAA